ncbi:hypothetical protein BC936DRAFT_148651 [Jimgerdemannia flammicorona]|uniref:HMG box domain-containing protein n=1 Tax=Jimgerdemannia flammicorona TaxID=994334 RepID=A0A433D2L8_9FUNG|nr:hypothetical protein BC936DRAFT_148651 [Jimgerdemannia flammicorona]
MTYRMDKQHEIMAKWPGVNKQNISRIIASMWKREEKERYRAIVSAMVAERLSSNEYNNEDTTATALDSHQQQKRHPRQQCGPRLCWHRADLGHIPASSRPEVSPDTLEVSSGRVDKKEGPSSKELSIDIYRMDKQYEIMAQWPGVNNNDITRIVASMWKRETEEERERYRAIAKGMSLIPIYKPSQQTARYLSKALCREVTIPNNANGRYNAREEGHKNENEERHCLNRPILPFV